MTKKIMIVFGTRPEAIKMAPVIKALEATPELEPITVVTGQHREMLQQVLDIFDLKPAYDLAIMQEKQTLTTITNKVLKGLDPILERVRPDMVLVHGDTTTTMAAAMAAFYHQIPVGHVEAGLRTWTKYSPYPEEMNRQLTDNLTDLYFAPSQQAAANLTREGHPRERIKITGNTVIDALHYTITEDYHHELLKRLTPTHRTILLTMHRRENQGKKMEGVFQAIRHVVESRGDIDLVYPVHLSPVVQKAAHRVFDGVDNVYLIDPLNVVDFHNLAARSYFIMTDSGGIQEEAPSLNRPVLVLRETTERPEGVKAGTLKLVGTDPATVEHEMNSLLENPLEYSAMAQAKNPYGDGHAAEKIVKSIQSFLAQV